MREKRREGKNERRKEETMREKRRDGKMKRRKERTMRERGREGKEKRRGWGREILIVATLRGSKS